MLCDMASHTDLKNRMYSKCIPSRLKPLITLDRLRVRLSCLKMIYSQI